jgi:hypothetical protein
MAHLGALLMDLAAASAASSPPLAAALDETATFDRHIDTYIHSCASDEQLFNLGPYNDRARTGAIHHKGLAALASLISALLHWCPSCSTTKAFLKDACQLELHYMRYVVNW